MHRDDSGSPQLRPSLLDRLVDERHDQRRGDGGTTARGGGDGFLIDPKAYVDSVRRDLEALLNTRFHIPLESLEGYEEVKRSLVVYGLPDFSGSSARSAADMDALRSAIERAIEVFDGRLRQVRVDVLEAVPGAMGGVRFRVDALVDLKPAAGRVFFDAAVSLGSERIEIKTLQE